MSAERNTAFLANFLLLSVISGLTVGLGKIVTTLYALSLGATPFQIGVVSAMESLGMVFVTVPAGFIIARYGARGVYFFSSLGPMLVNLLMPLSGSWIALASGRWFIGLCIPFRMVSMNSAFLERLDRIGHGKAGWYRASLTGGIAIVAPALASFLTGRWSVAAIFWTVAALFAIMALFSLSFLPSRDPAAHRDNVSVIEELQLILANARVAESCLIEFASSATNALFSTFVIVLAASLPGLTTQDGIHVMLFQGVTVVAMLFLAGPIVQRLGVRTAYGASFAAAALLAFGLAQGFPHLAIGAALLSVGSALVHLVNVRMLASLPGGKSKVAGLYNLASMTGASAGAILGGLLSKVVPLQSVFLLWLPMLLVAAFGIRALANVPHVATGES